LLANPDRLNMTANEQFFVLLPCAGSGQRAGTAQPKQYEPLAGVPLVVHTLRSLGAVPAIQRGVLVVAPDDTRMAPLLQQYPQPGYDIAAVGGVTRASSVLAGLQFLLTSGARREDWVLVHDAARCLIQPDDVIRLIDACRSDPVGGLLAVPLADTLKMARHGRVQGTLDRSDKWLAQTPQMFRCGLLLDALLQAGDAVTDEASAIEHLGHAPLLVRGGSHNFKVTYPQDFVLAQALLQARTPASGDAS
jgi:2-C-methyl-D-erythritol 4-phosphate cytidylyltransferase